MHDLPGGGADFVSHLGAFATPPPLSPSPSPNSSRPPSSLARPLAGDEKFEVAIKFKAPQSKKKKKLPAEALTVLSVSLHQSYSEFLTAVAEKLECTVDALDCESFEWCFQSPKNSPTVKMRSATEYDLMMDKVRKNKKREIFLSMIAINKVCIHYLLKYSSLDFARL